MVPSVHQSVSAHMVWRAKHSSGSSHDLRQTPSPSGTLPLHQKRPVSPHAGAWVPEMQEQPSHGLPRPLSGQEQMPSQRPDRPESHNDTVAVFSGMAATTGQSVAITSLRRNLRGIRKRNSGHTGGGGSTEELERRATAGPGGKGASELVECLSIDCVFLSKLECGVNVERIEWTARCPCRSNQRMVASLHTPRTGIWC